MEDGRGYHIHSVSSKTKMPTSLMSPIRAQIDKDNIDDYCYQPSAIHAMQQRDVGGLLLVPTHASVLKLPLVDMIQEDCSPPTFTLHKGFDYIKMRMATFLPCISALQIFTNRVKSL